MIRIYASQTLTYNGEYPRLVRIYESIGKLVFVVNDAPGQGLFLARPEFFRYLRKHDYTLVNVQSKPLKSNDLEPSCHISVIERGKCVLPRNSKLYKRIYNIESVREIRNLSVFDKNIAALLQEYHKLAYRG